MSASIAVPENRIELGVMGEAEPRALQRALVSLGIPCRLMAIEILPCPRSLGTGVPRCR